MLVLVLTLELTDVVLLLNVCSPELMLRMVWSPELMLVLVLTLVLVEVDVLVEVLTLLLVLLTVLVLVVVLTLLLVLVDVTVLVEVLVLLVSTKVLESYVWAPEDTDTASNQPVMIFFIMSAPRLLALIYLQNPDPDLSMHKYHALVCQNLLLYRQNPRRTTNIVLQ